MKASEHEISSKESVSAAEFIVSGHRDSDISVSPALSLVRTDEEPAETCSYSEVENMQPPLISIQTLSGTSFAVTMDSESTVDELREAVSSRLGTHVEQLKLTYLVCCSAVDWFPVYVGHEPSNRQHRDTGKCMHLLTEYEFKVSGSIASWELYSWGLRTVQLQVWRPGEGLEYTLVGEVSAQIAEGHNSIGMESHEEIHVQPGDVLGWYMEGVQAIVFDIDDAESELVRRVYGTHGTAKTLNMSSHAIGWFRSYSIRTTVKALCGDPMPLLVDRGTAVATLIGKTLHAVVLPRTFGNKPIFRSSADTGNSMHFVTDYTIDVAGNVIRFELFSNGPRIAKLQVWRPVGNLRYDLVGEVTSPIQQGYNSVDVEADSEIRVSAGDVIGWFMEGVQAIPFEATHHGPRVRRVYRTGGQVVEIDMSGHPEGWFRRYSLRAIVAPET